MDGFGLEQHIHDHKNKKDLYQHTTQYTDDILPNCIPETHMILLTNVIPIKSIKIKLQKTFELS